LRARSAAGPRSDRGAFFYGKPVQLLLSNEAMNLLSRRSLVLLPVYAAAAAIAQAHPGHEGHEGGDITWDFGHLAAHPFATLAVAALVAGAAWVIWSQLRSRRSLSTQSLRKSTDSR
jgi:hypothetical protein